jgi:hypothetical protein
MVSARMKTFVESLSIWSGAILVALLSSGLVSLVCSVCPEPLRKFWAVIVPFVLASCLYWSPVWFGADPSEYHAWALVVIGPWFLAGALPSAAIVYMRRNHQIR